MFSLNRKCRGLLLPCAVGWVCSKQSCPVFWVVGYAVVCSRWGMHCILCSKLGMHQFAVFGAFPIPGRQQPNPLDFWQKSRLRTEEQHPTSDYSFLSPAFSSVQSNHSPLVAAQLTANPGGTTVITLFFPLLHVHNPNENLEALLLVVL